MYKKALRVFNTTSLKKEFLRRSQENYNGRVYLLFMMTIINKLQKQHIWTISMK